MGASGQTQRHQNLATNGIVNEKLNYNVCAPVFKGFNDRCTVDCCISYRLQSHCIDNRHFHAWIKKYGRASCLHVLDLTHHKLAKTWIPDDSELDFLPSKIVSNAGLQMCNVIGFHKDFVVTQLFCQGAVKFIITGFNDNECKIILNKPYLQQQKLQLYESYISPDENFMVLRQNPIYAQMYANEIENVEGVILAKLKWLTGNGEIVPCENLLLFIAPSNHKFSLTFDPRTNNDLVIFTYVDGSDRCNLSLYKVMKDLVLFQIALFNNEFSVLPGRFQNLQFFKDGSALLLTVLGSTSNGSLAIGPAICRDRFATMFWLDPVCYDKLGSFSYISVTSAEHYTPMISASGRHCFCGGKLYNVQKIQPSLNSLKTLKQMCVNVVLDTVLSEDLSELPLPKPIIYSLQHLTV